MCERDVTARVNYYICAGSEHLFGFRLKCNKNYIILKKMPSAAQWNILHHPSTYGTKITGIKNFGHLCLGALYISIHGYHCVSVCGVASLSFAVVTMVVVCYTVFPLLCCIGECSYFSLSPKGSLCEEISSETRRPFAPQ